MVVRKRKKVRRFRGKRSYGYGSHKKHRGGGSRGGRGKAGMHKHKWSYTVKYEPERFGKRGFKSVAAKAKAEAKTKAINLKQLDALAKRMGKKEINLAELGYGKLLGAGKITKPLIIKVKTFSAQAKQKIEKAGGKVTAQAKKK